MSGTLALDFDIVLAVAPERVFRAISEGRHLERWFCDACESEPHEDGRLTMRWHRPFSSPWPYEATWVVFEAPRHCACAGGHQGYPNRDGGVIDFSVESDPAGARLRVRHSMPDTPDYAPFAEQYRTAWPRSLQRLAGYLTPSS